MLLRLVLRGSRTPSMAVRPMSAGFVVPAPPTTSLAVVGEADRFPVRRVFCVGRNFAEHAKEMGADTREPPFYFSKPADALVDVSGSTSGAAPHPIPYPPATEDLHHEVEMVVAIGRGGTDIAVADALAHVYGFGVGVDLTRRDLQAQAKAMRRPWDLAKGFDASGPVGAITPVAALPGADAAAMGSGAIELRVNGATAQSGDMSELVWSTAELVANLSSSVALAAGDVIFTGTPAGVGALQRGDVVEASVAGLETVHIELV